MLEAATRELQEESGLVVVPSALADAGLIHFEMESVDGGPPMLMQVCVGVLALVGCEGYVWK